MGKIRVGNKENSKLNGEWAGHVRGKIKKVTSGKRRAKSKEIINGTIKETKEETEYQKLENKIFNYKTKYREGFIKSEIEQLLEELNINERRFYKALGVNTCMLIDGEVITYHTDILKGVICAKENREQNILEWD